MEQKLCLECHALLHGRTDKRFCDDGCRNAYNNRLNSQQNNYVRRITNLLKKNRRILEQQLGKEKMKKVPTSKLIDAGFVKEYHTHTLQTTKGHTYYFCFEYGYLPLEQEMNLIVKNKDNTSAN